MRPLLLLLYVANLALQYASWRLHPGRVAVHFGPGGRADGWGDSAAHSLGLSALLTFFLIVFVFMPSWVSRLPVRWVNLPHREYWLAPERRGDALARLAGLLHRFGIAFFLFFLGMGGLVLQARSRAPGQLDQSMFLTLMVLLMAYVAVWLHAIRRAFPPPPR